MIPSARSLVACVVALAAACGRTMGQPEEPREHTGGAPASASASTSATVGGAARMLDTANAEAAVPGRDYAEVLDLPIWVSGNSIGVLALTDDGRALASAAKASTFDDGVLTQEQSTVGLRGRDGFSALPRPRRSGPVRHPVYGDSRGPYSPTLAQRVSAVPHATAHELRQPGISRGGE